ncbi:MAG: hypothetical protein IT452_07515 [Planctomycetia bacterium]|nr:hypothetical protein [Planctomycetia bacterium]
MSELNVFLVPTDKPLSGRRGIKDRILDYLEGRGIVAGFYDEKLEWYAAGPRSFELFRGSAAGGPAFEYAIIYDRNEAHFVPDAHTAGFGARCVSCQADLDEPVYQVLEEQGECSEVKDVAAVSIRCPSCRHPNPLVTLQAEVETAVTRFYINFCAVESLDVNPAILAELREIVGAELALVVERL